MENTLRHYQDFCRDRTSLLSLLQAVAFFVIGAIAVFHAVSYATVHASNHVTDIILSNVQPLNVRFLFVYGTFAEFAILAALLLVRPRRLPFALKGIGLFLLVRAVFIMLTHLGPFPIDPQKPAPFFNSIFYGG